MSGWITLTRKRAAVKLGAARAAEYFFERDGRRYTRPVNVEELVRAFSSDLRARLRIRLSDSQHVVFIESNAGRRIGYEVQF